MIKSLTFLIWLLMVSVAFGTNFNAVSIGDTANFTITYTSGIDSARLTLDMSSQTATLSLMPIAGLNHTTCYWEGAFDVVDSSGTYRVKIYTYVSAAINDSIFGTCRVEPSWFSVSVDEVRIASDETLTTVLGNVNGSVGLVTGAVGSVTGNVGGSVASVSGNVGGNVTGSVGSISGITFPTNFSDLAITVTTGLIDINTKTGFSLSDPQTWSLTGNITGNLSGSVGSISGVTFPTNFSDLAITVMTGLVDVNDKTGFSLASQDWTTDSDITTLKSDLSTTHGAGSWATATSVIVSDKTGFSLASNGLDGVTQGSGYVLSRPDLDNASGDLDSNKFADDYYHGIAVASDSGAAAGGGAGAAEIIDTLLGRGYFTGLGDKNDTIFVFDNADTTVIAGVNVIVRPLSGGTPIARGWTDLNGMFIVRADSLDTIQVYLVKQAYDFNDVDSIIVIVDGRDSIWGDAFSPDPGPANMTDIFTWILTPGGDTLYPSYLSYQIVDSRGEEFDSDTRITYGSGSNTILLTIGEVEITADSSLVQFSLFPNSSLNITSTKYKFRARYLINRKPFLNTEFVIAIPDTTSINPFGL